MRRPIRLLRDLSGRSRADLADLLLHQVAAGLDGARIARRAATAEVGSALARAEMTQIEHAGDGARAQLVTVLAGSLVTPFDREDMFRVSRSIDDVLDNLRDFVRELDLLCAADDRLVPVIDALIESMELLHAAIASVPASGAEVGERVLAAKKSCNEIRRTYQVQLATLLDGEVTAAMLRRREVLRRLDVVGLRLGEAVDALADAAVKRGL